MASNGEYGWEGRRGELKKGLDLSGPRVDLRQVRIWIWSWIWASGSGSGSGSGLVDLDLELDLGWRIWI